MKCVLGLLVAVVGLGMPVLGAADAYAGETLDVRAQKNVVEIQGFAASLANAEDAERGAIFSGSYGSLSEKTNALYDELQASSAADAEVVSEIEQSLDALTQLASGYST